VRPFRSEHPLKSQNFRVAVIDCQLFQMERRAPIPGEAFEARCSILQGVRGRRLGRSVSPGRWPDPGPA
jgi:hypothetical protein